MDFEATLEQFVQLEPAIEDMKKVLWVLDAPRTPEIVELARSLNSSLIHMMVRVTHGYVQFHRSGHVLFLAILQQYDLPPKIRKTIEACAKFYSKTRVNRPDKASVIPAYEKALATYRSHLAAAKEALKQGTLRGSGETAVKSWKAGPLNVVNTGGFSDAVMDEAVEVVGKAVRLLQQKGLGKVCYGDVLISNTLSRPNVLAFYLTTKDELFVRANLKGKKHDAVHTVIHELAHRLHFKFLKSKDREIIHLFRMLGAKDQNLTQKIVSDPANKPSPGETLEEGGKVFVVTNVMYDTVQLVHQESGARARIPLMGWLARKNVLNVPSAFVTKYARKNHEENFAEMVAAYCLGVLSEDQEKLLLPIIE